jgi:uncharacterized protein (DUF1786 family)
MKILTIDIGTGTQDIYLYNSQLDIENGLKMVVPSPTLVVNKRLKQATQSRSPVILTGVTMGGGPNAWAAEAHIKAGLPLLATPDAARTFNDDLEAVQAMGIKIISEDEISILPDSYTRIDLHDFDFEAIRRAMDVFEVSLSDLAAVAVAVFDHGAAPPDVSDRKFRFDYLDERIRSQNRLSAFAYLSPDIPSAMTRMQAVAQSAKGFDCPLVVMDTAPAAVMGTTFDLTVQERRRKIIVNVGNFHTLAFRMGLKGIEGVFEHHTGLLDTQKLDAYLLALANSSLNRQTVFDDHGHGALIYDPMPLILPDNEWGVVVTGPRRSLMNTSRLHPYHAVPFGDMMIAGCLGLLAATADILPDLAEPIQESLQNQAGAVAAPWDVE